MVHIPATIAFMAYSYRFFQPQIFQSTRRTLVVCNCLAFIIFSSWPCMPPRLLPFREFGYIDTLHSGKAASIWTTNKVNFPHIHLALRLTKLVPKPTRSVPIPPFWLLFRHWPIPLPLLSSQAHPSNLSRIPSAHPPRHHGHCQPLHSRRRRRILRHYPGAQD